MSTVSSFPSINTSLPATAASDSAKLSASTTTAKESSERFLKLLVAQLQNQDPLNPTDNAQVTSQIAQINTVSGIEKLNSTVEGLSGQYMQMQSLQGAALIGRQVVVEGNQLDVAGGNGSGGFSLASDADAVKVEVLNAAGSVVRAVDLGAQRAGMNGFSVPATGFDNTSGLTFRVSASLKGAALAATPLMTDKVSAVSTQGNALQLELARGGNVAYSAVKATS